MAASSAGIREIEIGQSEVSRYNESIPVGLTDDYIEWLKDQTAFTCNHHTTGSECQFCEPGYIGNPLDGTPEDCKPCPCPLENHNHALSCRFEPKDEAEYNVPSEAFIDSEFMVIIQKIFNYILIISLSFLMFKHPTFFSFATPKIATCVSRFCVQRIFSYDFASSWITNCDYCQKCFTKKKNEIQKVIIKCN